MRITHIIIGLEVGGAELMLKRLIEADSGNPAYQHQVISLTNIGSVGKSLLASGVPVYSMNLRGPLDFVRVLVQLRRAVSDESPDIVQTWMYHADLLGGIAARIAGIRNVIWGIRGTAIPQKGLSLTRVVIWLCALLSRVLPAAIVCNAQSARLAHLAFGYSGQNMRVIPNGYDIEAFNYDPDERKKQRAGFGFIDTDIVIGAVGRFDPLKDYRNFVAAVSRVARSNPNVKILMIGRNINVENLVLTQWINTEGSAEQFSLLDERNDIPACLLALDIFCLSSLNEGFPNVVCEAMAMHLPCVVTDAGDAREIVGDSGIVVPPADTDALAAALQQMVEVGGERRHAIGMLARRRVEENYTIEAASSRFKMLYGSLVNA